MIAIDLSKQQALEIQQIDFTANLDRAGYTKMFFIIEKETLLTRNSKSFVNDLILINIK